MKTREDVIEKLKKYPESITITPGLETSAVQLAEELYGNSTEERRAKRSFKLNWKLLSSACACLVVGMVCVAIIFSDTTPAVNNGDYYLSTDLEAKVVDDLTSFLGENDFNCEYYESGYLTTSANAFFLINEPDRLMFIVQDTMFLSESGVDIITLGVTFEIGRFQNFDEFEETSESMSVLSVPIEYFIKSENEANIIYSKFFYENKGYFLKIKTCGDEKTLSDYVTKLLDE